MRASAISAVYVAALLRYGATIALVLAAAQAAGAGPPERASRVAAIGSGVLSAWMRVPLVLAWSTPGAALIAASAVIALPQALAAFILVGLLVALTGALPPLGRLVAAIPPALASAMLRGAASVLHAAHGPGTRHIRPRLHRRGAVRGAHGQHGAVRLGPEVHPDRDRRWIVGLAYAAVWGGLGLAGTALVAITLALPTGIVAVVAGLALMAPFLGAAPDAFEPLATRFPAAVTLFVTASGVGALGIGSAFWGLVAGLAVLGLDRLRRP